MVRWGVQGNRSDVPDADGTGDDPVVACAFDDVDGLASFLVADRTRDDAWLSVAVADAADLRAWR